jgi:hypothetical protein
MDEFGKLGDAGLQRQLIVLRAFIEALIVTNWQYLQIHPDTPSLYEIAPRYALKARARERDTWQDLPETYAKGFGDCKDLSAIRCAELRRDGCKEAHPFIRIARYIDPEKKRPPLIVHHVQVVTGYGQLTDFPEIEDPSAILGMPKTVSYRDLAAEPPAAGIPHARWGALDWARMST